MPLCLSYFQRDDEEVLRNHAHYCRLYGYPHRCVDSAGIFDPALRDAHRYSQILRHLRSLPEGDWLLFLDSDAVVLRPIAIDTLLEGRDALIVDGPQIPGLATTQVMTGMLVLRNTAANRGMLHEMVADASRVIALETVRIDESARLRTAGVLEGNSSIAGTFVHVSWRMGNWYNAHIFVLNLGPLPVVGRDGAAVADKLHDPNLQNLMVRQVNGALMQGQPLLHPPEYAALSDAPLSSYNAEASIAFVTLYTPQIASYARVSEHNVKRYCDRHGYAYHVYRAVPEALGPDLKGNWAKPWVLREHLAQHEWIIWIDADMLFVSPAIPFEPLLAGRDLLVAKDIGAWHVNSGLMGFRRTPGNAELLAQLWQRIVEVPDKSSVYASMGDQYYVNALLRERGLDGERDVLDFASINTPPHLRSANTLLVHFLGLGEPYRSCYMADQDLASLRAG
jgi:hypothetical protein